jgi:hypothetical protein
MARRRTSKSAKSLLTRGHGLAISRLLATKHPWREEQIRVVRVEWSIPLKGQTSKRGEETRRRWLEFIRLSLKFWTGETRRLAWTTTTSVVILVGLQLMAQLGVNFRSRFFSTRWSAGAGRLLAGHFSRCHFSLPVAVRL